MEDNDGSDFLWLEFLTSINGPNVSNASNVKSEENEDIQKLASSSLFEDGDDPNDPDYNLFKDLQNGDFDEDDLNFDEYLDFLNEPTITGDANDSPESDDTFLESQSDVTNPFTSEQIRILQSQLTFHVQTLTQTWMLSTNCIELEQMKNDTVGMLQDLTKISKEKPTNDSLGTFAHLKIHNLSGAIALIEERGKDIESAEKRYSFQLMSEFSRKLILARRDIFQFDWALPNSQFTITSSDAEKKVKKFSLAEDFLLAIGLSECPKSKRFFNFAYLKIQEKHFLPSRSMNNIRTRIKHLRRILNDLSALKEEIIKHDDRLAEFSINPVICLMRDGKLPPVHCFFEDPLLDTYRKFRRPPRWFCTQMEADKEEKVLEIDETASQCSSEICPKTTRLIVPKVDILGAACDSAFGNNISLANNVARSIIFPIITPSPSLNIPPKTKRKRSTSSKDAKKAEKRDHKKKVRFSDQVEVVLIETSLSPTPVSEPQICLTTDFSNNLVESKSNSSKCTEKTCNADKVEADTNTNQIGENSSEGKNEPEKIENIEIVTTGSSNLEESSFPLHAEDDEEESVREIDEIFIEDEDVEVEDEEESDKLVLDEDSEADKVTDPMDDENDLNALMEASCTAVSNRARNSASANEGESKRKAYALARQRDSSLLVLRKQIAEPFEKGAEEEIRQELLIGYYLKRAQTILTAEEHERFLQVMVTLLGSQGSNVTDPSINSQTIKMKPSASSVYNHLKEFLAGLSTKYAQEDNPTQHERILGGIKELSELLVLFLDFSQAQHCEEAFKYLHWKRIFGFMQSVENYLKHFYEKRNQQLGCMKRLLKALNQINQLALQKHSNDEQTKLKIKSVVSKALNGNALLVNEFSTLFLDDPPARHLYANAEDFDEFTLPADDQTSEDRAPLLENVTIPMDENDLKYGTSECPCKECHSTGQENAVLDQPSGNQMKHCSACSLRFIAARDRCVLYVPQFNNSTKKMQLVEHVQQMEADGALGIEVATETSSKQTVNELTGQVESSISPATTFEPWTIDEDRMLLEACRSRIVNLQITQLTETVFDSVAQRVAVNFERRTSKELSHRLRHLIEMLTDANKP